MKKMLTSRKAMSYFIGLFTVTLIVLLGLVPGMLGYRPVATHGSSMEPALRTGDALLTKQVDAAGLKGGEIVVIVRQGRDAVVHRVVGIEPLPDGRFLLQTKGDANDFSEWWKVEGNAKLPVAILRLPWLGHVLVFIKTPTGLAAALAAAALLMVILAMAVSKRWRQSG
jgi:signal peptidase